MDKVIQKGAAYAATAYEIARHRSRNAVSWELDAVYPSGRRAVLGDYLTYELATGTAAVLAGRVGRIVAKADSM